MSDLIIFLNLIYLLREFKVFRSQATVAHDLFLIIQIYEIYSRTNWNPVLRFLLIFSLWCTVWRLWLDPHSISLLLEGFSFLTSRLLLDFVVVTEFRDYFSFCTAPFAIILIGASRSIMNSEWTVHRRIHWSWAWTRERVCFMTLAQYAARAGLGLGLSHFLIIIFAATIDSHLVLKWMRDYVADSQNKSAWLSFQ